jgi:hypothetical protein
LRGVPVTDPKEVAGLAVVFDRLRAEAPSRKAAVTAISLISQAPEQLWTWDLVTEVPFGTGLPQGSRV